MRLSTAYSRPPSTHPSPLAAALPRAARAALILLAGATASGCRGEADYGIDPEVLSRPLPGPGTPLDTALTRVGEAVFRARCVACHDLEPGVAVGPDLRGVAERRTPEWIRGMVLDPDSMLRHDSIAGSLLVRYRVPMIDVGIGEAEFRAVLEFLRSRPG